MTTTAETATATMTITAGYEPEPPAPPYANSCHMTTRDFARTPSTYVGIPICMWVRLLSPKLEDNTISEFAFVMGLPFKGPSTFIPLTI
jgi:hypothetical protein